MINIIIGFKNKRNWKLLLLLYLIFEIGLHMAFGLAVILFLFHLWALNCYTTQTYLVVSEMREIKVRENDYVRMSMPSTSDITFGGLLQIIQKQSQIVARITKNGILKVPNPNLLTIFSQFNFKQQSPALGHSMDYMNNNQKRQYICYDEFSGPFCIWKITKAANIKNNKIKVEGHRIVLYFQEPVKLSQIKGQFKTKICKDSLLSKCLKYNKEENAFIRDAPFYLALQKGEKRKQNNLRQEDLLVKWSKISIVNESIGPKITIEQQISFSELNLKYYILISILVLAVTIYKYLRQMRKADKIKVAVSEKGKECQSSTQCFNL